ncbi:hypothetical protein DMH17_07250 [Raoultella planticola]|nr:hypothetical protein [Raoultella planticola]
MKVLAIIGMIGLACGCCLAATAAAKPDLITCGATVVSSPPAGMASVMSLAVIMFSFGGLELIGITAAEAQIRKRAFRKRSTVVYRILLFISVRWWCCWRSIRGWKLSPTAVRL